MNLQEMLGDAYKEGMTVDEINEALKDKELPKDNSSEIAKLRDSLTRANAEASQYKKELKEKLSADELKAKEDAEARERMEKELADLRREKSISSYKAKFLENGYDKDLADKSAEALADGDFTTVFSYLNKHLANLEKKFKADDIDRTPKPTGGEVGDQTITKEQFENMSYIQRNELYQKNKDLYDQLSK